MKQVAIVSSSNVSHPADRQCLRLAAINRQIPGDVAAVDIYVRVSGLRPYRLELADNACWQRANRNADCIPRCIVGIYRGISKYSTVSGTNCHPADGIPHANSNNCILYSWSDVCCVLCVGSEKNPTGR